MSILRDQIYILKARLADARKLLKNLDLKADAHLVSVQQKMSPYNELQDLDLDAVLVSVQELKNIQDEYKELASKIKEMESDLNG
ncbi:MAG: hypothetical protein LCH54_15595 [Bacteroidetes bacterium]|nr:hypothetical protein [Bacteroidota bacterium]